MYGPHTLQAYIQVYTNLSVALAKVSVSFGHLMVSEFVRSHRFILTVQMDDCILPCFCTIFRKGNNFCDLLFASLDEEDIAEL